MTRDRPEVVFVVRGRVSSTRPPGIVGCQVSITIGFLMQLDCSFKMMGLPSPLPICFKGFLYARYREDPLTIGRAFAPVRYSPHTNVVFVAEGEARQIAVAFVEDFVTNVSLNVCRADNRRNLPPPVALKIRCINFGGEAHCRTNQPLVNDVHTIATHVEVLRVERLLFRIDTECEWRKGRQRCLVVFELCTDFEIERLILRKLRKDFCVQVEYLNFGVIGESVEFFVHGFYQGPKVLPGTSVGEETCCVVP